MIRFAFNKLKAIDGATTPAWVPVVSAMPLWGLGVGFGEGGVLEVSDPGGQPSEVSLAEDFGLSFSIQLSDGVAGELVVRSPGRFDIQKTGGVVASVRYAGGVYYLHVLCRPVTYAKICGSKLRFSGDGSVRIDGQHFLVGESFDVQLANGVRAVRSDGESGVFAITGPCLGVQAYQYLGQAGWRECWTSKRDWSYGRVLNGETSDAVELFGTVKLYSNGNVELAGTEAFSRFSEVEATHVDPSGRGALLIKRQAGSDLLEIFEDQFDSASANALYKPQSVVGKDGKTLYDAWWFSASSTSLPTGCPGNKPLQTAALGLVFAAFISAFVYPVVAGLLCSVSCLGVVVISVHRSFKLLRG